MPEKSSPKELKQLKSPVKTRFFGCLERRENRVFKPEKP
jgi:hypothetical protein